MEVSQGVDASVQYGATTILFKVHFTQRKTLGIEVHPDQSVKVIAPINAKLDRILKKVERKAKWIQKQVRGFEKLGHRESKKEYISGENYFYLGRQYRLKLLKGKPAAKLEGKYLRLSLPDKNNKQLAAELIEAWYKERAAQKLIARFEKHLHIAEKEKIKINRLLIRPLKKRWGSCTKKGTITLNTELIKAPVNCIDYVIIHELCHLKHLNHSKKFYRLLARYCPDWEKLREKVNRF